TIHGWASRRWIGGRVRPFWLGKYGLSKKCGLLGATQHQVEVLDGDAGGTFDEVVEAGEDDDLASEDAQGDVAIVGVGGVLCRRQVTDDTDEWAAGVERAIEPEQVMLDGRLPGTGVDRGEDSPVHGHEVGSEDDFDRFASPAGHGRQHLVDLGGLVSSGNTILNFSELGLVSPELLTTTHV